MAANTFTSFQNSSYDFRAQAALLDTVSEGMIVRRGDKLLYLNKAIMNMFGVDADSAHELEKPVSEWIHPEDRHVVEDVYSKRVKGDLAPDIYDFRIISMTGEELWISCRAQVIDWHGEPAVAASFKDITVQKKSVDNEQFTMGLFENIFNVTPEFMLLFNLNDGCVVDVNPTFLNVFGRRREEVIGTPIEELGIISDPTFHERFIEELKTAAFLTDIPVALSTRGGLMRHFRLFARKIEGTGKPYLLMTGRDVTDENARAQEMQRNRDEAELSNRTKSEFLANMSHELRTPLNAILGFSELIRDQITGPHAVDKYSEYAADIYKSGSHLLSIINDILDLSKVEAGRLEAHLEWLNPSVCLNMCLSLVNQRAFESGVTIDSDFDNSLHLMADERLLKQIGLNLLSNAVKFTKAGGVVNFSLVRIEDQGACLKVADSGIGMTPEEIYVAQRPFGQVDSSLSRRQDGSGLGLPLVAAFTEKLGAKMTIESKPDVGTTVCIHFPANKIRLIDQADEVTDVI
ncbi:PAS domain-containing sensor histidine kinase [Kordiimonas aquimaris]|uniref:PAS domain-containing sensor histidine kinase n=1 Tax=Kordiimonas aquimaris TaxID=707591 RepID=UPI0021D3122D|nr:PAS domain-containing sensor histidine kinase [Kordiimonas aquimaris]